MKRLLALSAVLFCCLSSQAIWILQPGGGGSSGGATNGIQMLNGFGTNTTFNGASIASASITSGTISSAVDVSGVTNVAGFSTTAFQLYNNKTGTYQGKKYSFPSSTTAGFQEIQQLVYQTPTDSAGAPNKPFCPVVELMDNGFYDFSTQIWITNQMTIKGQGPLSTILRYVGPTNIITMSQVTNLAMKAIFLTESSAYVPPNSELCGLINFIGTGTQINAATITNEANNLILKDLGVMPLTNFPCYEICVGPCEKVTMDSVYCLAAESLGAFNQGYYVIGLQPTTNVNTVVPFFSNAFDYTDLKNCSWVNTACGPIIAGNTVLIYQNNEPRMLGDANHKTNGFPRSCPISIPFGMYSTGGPIMNYIIPSNDYGTAVPYLVEGPFTFSGMFVQSGAYAQLAAGINGASGVILSDTAKVLGAMITDGAGNYTISTTNQDVINTIVATQITKDGVYSENTQMVLNPVLGSTSTWQFQTNVAAQGNVSVLNPIGGGITNGFASPTTTTNALPVAATGVTNTLAINYVFSMTAGTGVTVQDPANHTFATLPVNSCMVLHPGWRVTGTGITAICYPQ